MFKKNYYDISIFNDIIDEKFIDDCMNSANKGEYSVQQDWLEKLDNPCFNANINIADEKNIMKFDKRFADKLLSNVKNLVGHDRVETSGHFIYPPTGYMGWHTNHTNPCTLHYICHRG